MRKLTQRLTSSNGFYKSHLFQFMWLLALLIFVQQIGKSQTLSLGSPCECKDDQSANGAKDGSFTDSVIVKGLTASSDTFTVVELIKATATGIDPIPMWNSGFGKFTSIGDSLYALTVMHFDSSGYRIIVEGPKSFGTSGNWKDTILNVCRYPVIQWNPAIASKYSPTNTTVNLSVSEVLSEAGDTTITVNGIIAKSFNPFDLGIGVHKIIAQFDGKYQDSIGTLVMPAFPGCNTDIMNTFSIESDSVMVSPCNCTGAMGPNTMPFVDTITLKGINADSFTVDSIIFINPNTKLVTAGAFFKVNSILGDFWKMGDTLQNIGVDSFQFVGYFTGDVDAILTFVNHGGMNSDTVKVNISACGNTSDLAILGPDTICQGGSAMFTLSKMVDSVSWTLGSYGPMNTDTFNIASVDTNGWVTVSATGSIQGTCIPFTVDKSVFVQDTSFEIEGSLYSCLYDTIDYNLNLKGTFANYNTINGLKWGVLGGGKIIGDSVNTLNIKVMWDSMVTPHMVLVNGITTTGCAISDTITVKVDSILAAQIVGPQIVCLGETRGYRSKLAKIDTLLWRTIPDSISSVVEISEDSVNITWNKVGTYKISVSGSADGFGCKVIDSTFLVEVRDTNFMITGFEASCQGDSTGFGIRNLDGSPIALKNLTWQVVRNADNVSVAPKDTLQISGNVSPGVLDSINVIWDSIGFHTIIATGETVDGCTVSESKVISSRDSIFRIFGDTIVCLMTTTLYKVYDANHMPVANMQTINWLLKHEGGGIFPMPSDDSLFVNWLNLPGKYTLFVNGMTDDGCVVSDSIEIEAINPAFLKINGPSILCGARDTMWTFGLSDKFLNMVSWDIVGESGTFGSFDVSAIDTFKVSTYTFAPGVVWDSMNVVISGKVGTQCMFTDTLPLVIRDTSFQIFGPDLVCDLTDTSEYHVEVPGTKTVQWSFNPSASGKITSDTTGGNKDTVNVFWTENGTLIASIMTYDGCMIVDSLPVFVSKNSEIVGDTAVSELDTVGYTLRGVTNTDTIALKNLKTITWTKPVNGTIINTSASGDSITVAYSGNLTGDPIYLDTIQVAFMTNDGCMDTVRQAIQIRETTYGLMGMDEACLAGTFKWTIGSFTLTDQLIDLPDSIVGDIDTIIWTLPDGGGTVVSSDGDSVLLNFTFTGTFKVMAEGLFNDGCVFSFMDSITVRSNQLALVGDVDGILCEGQPLNGYSIEEVNGGKFKTLGINEFDGIFWAVANGGDIDGGTADNLGNVNVATVESAAVSASPLSASKANIASRLFSDFVSGFGPGFPTNGEYKGMVSSINATFPTPGTADSIFVSLVTSAGCALTEVVDIAVHNRVDGASIACNNLINISLGTACDLVITPDMILEDPQFDLGEYSIILTDADGKFISNGRLGPNEIGKQIRVTVTHDCSGNSCWGLLFVEDKNIPDLMCTMDTINCDNSLDPLDNHWNFPNRYKGFPIPVNAHAVAVDGEYNTYRVTNFDLCSEGILVYHDNTDVQACLNGVSKTVLRSWTFTNGSGLTSTCIDTFVVEKLDIDSIDFRQYIPHQAYDCSQKDDILLENGYPNPEITGSLDDVKDDPCFQLNAGYTDTSIPLCGNSWKFFRYWTIIDWCTAEDTTLLQIIAFEDKTDPIVNRPEVFDNISNDHECTNTFSIRKPIYNDCSDIIRVVLELRKVGYADWIEYAEKDNPNEDFLNITFGVDGDQVEARFILTDDCGNRGTSSPSDPIDIQDNITPTAVCDDEVVITLNDDGIGFATYHSFDDGSSDNCGIVKWEIRRIATECPGDDGQSTQWGNLVMFCCADVGQDDVIVILRVTDAAGNSNSCETIVTVQDNLTKVFAQNVPEDVTVSCGADLSDLDGLFGFPIFVSSACGVKMLPDTVVIRSLDDCGKGVITRTWTVMTTAGVPVSAQQVITVGKSDEVLTADKIIFPNDIEIEGCMGSLDPETNPDLGVPIYDNVPCSQAIATYSDLIFTNTEGYCAKVIRTWAVVDWCTVDELDRNDPNALFFEGIQVIKLKDNVDPVIDSGCDDEIVSTNNSNCTGFFSFSATGSDDCGANALKWTYEVDFDKNGLVDLTGKASSFDAELAVGQHSITWTLSDGCVNVVSCTKMVTVMDENPPVLQCPAEHTVVLNDQGQASLALISLLAGSISDDCTPTQQLSLSFSANSEVGSLLFDCDSPLDMIQTIYVTDGSGNVGTCEVNINVDKSNACNNGNSLVSVSGRVFTENDHTVDNVDVRLTTMSDELVAQQMTPLSGEYAFDDVAMEGNYNLKPTKNDNYLNGVSTIDLLLIQNHILGLKSFTTPYKVIAADVDGSNSVSVIDMLHIRNLILGITTELPIGRSWTFVDALQQFNDILNPFPYTEIITMIDVSANKEAMDFVAIKMADVNGNVSLASAKISDNRSTAHLTIENSMVKANTMFSVPFEADRNVDLAGIQMGIHFDPDKVEFMGVYGNGFNITRDHLNEAYLEHGELVFSWNSNSGEAISIADGEALFELRFASKRELIVAEVLSVHNDYLDSEMYTSTGAGEVEVSSLYLNTRESELISGEMVLYQNRPNPFNSSTEIQFSLPVESPIELDVFDLAGRAVYHHEGIYPQGISKITIDEQSLGDGGIYIYQMADGANVVQMKMIFIK